MKSPGQKDPSRLLPQGRTLDEVVLLKAAAHGVEDRLLVGAPQGSQEAALVAVPGEAVDDHRRRQDPEAVL